MEMREEGDDVQQSDDLLQRWLTALRSGRYTQAREALKKGDSFCCLGVLCDVADPTGWFNAEIEADTYWESGDTHSQMNENPPDSLIEQVGLEEQDVGYLIELNDVFKEDFANIADTIEKMVREHKAEDGDA